MARKLPTPSSNQQKTNDKIEDKDSAQTQAPKVRPGSFAELISQ